MRLTRIINVLLTMVVVLITVAQETKSARILMVQPIGTRSHKNFFMAIAESLVLRNHTMTLVTGHQSSRQHPNIREVVVQKGNVFNSFNDLFNTSMERMTWDLYSSILTSCNEALSEQNVQDLLQEEFDLMMIYVYMTECFLSFAHKLKIPFIYVTPNKIHSDISNLARIPSLLAESFGLEYSLTFGSRLLSAVYDSLGAAFTTWFYLPRVDADCRALQLCPEDMPRLHELRLNSSLFITNSIRATEKPTLLYTPTVVHAGGIHCRPPKPLNENLQQWIVGAGEPGFIFFSLGTLVKTSTLPEKYRRVLLDVFGSLQQRVLWKWDEDTIDGLPANVRLSKWLPQQDILGHPKLRLFITHGGLLSTQEATYHGVPVLGIPIAFDQKSNMKMVQKKGGGRFLLWEDLTYGSLRDQILHIIGDTRMRTEAQRQSIVMKDQPVPPGEWTAYWVEHVLKYNGASHLRSPVATMPWYKLYNVDVWAVVVVVAVGAASLASFICYKSLQCILRYCCKSKKIKRH